MLRKLGVHGSKRENGKKKEALTNVRASNFGAPAGIRTLDTRLKRAVLYLLSYWGIYGWDGGTRTHYIGVKVRCVTITLHPNIMAIRTQNQRSNKPTKREGGIWGSNPRHPEPQSGALPTELIPPCNGVLRNLYEILTDEFSARQEGFEPPTYCLEGSCSILLSYCRIFN